jgi:hypothetical protein
MSCYWWATKLYYHVHKSLPLDYCILIWFSPTNTHTHTHTPYFCKMYFIIVNTATCFGLARSPSSGGNNVYMRQLVRAVRVSRLLAAPSTVDWNVQHVPVVAYTLLPPDDGPLPSPKHVEVYWLNILKINSAWSWFHCTHISRCTINKTYNLKPLVEHGKVSRVEPNVTQFILIVTKICRSVSVILFFIVHFIIILQYKLTKCTFFKLVF